MNSYHLAVKFKTNKATCLVMTAVTTAAVKCLAEPYSERYGR